MLKNGHTGNRKRVSAHSAGIAIRADAHLMHAVKIDLVSLLEREVKGFQVRKSPKEQVINRVAIQISQKGHSKQGELQIKMVTGEDLFLVKVRDHLNQGRKISYIKRGTLLFI